jgi:hypothetical protein
MDRYTDNRILIAKDGVRYRASTRYPDIPFSENDVFIYTVRGDRLDNLAYQFYQDATLWWILSIANPTLPNDSLYPPGGFQLRIPANKTKIVNDFLLLNETA